MSAQYGVVRLEIELVAGVSCANMAVMDNITGPYAKDLDCAVLAGGTTTRCLSQNENAYNNVPHEWRGHQVFTDSPLSGLARNLYDLRIKLDLIGVKGSRSDLRRVR